MSDDGSGAGGGGAPPVGSSGGGSNKLVMILSAVNLVITVGMVGLMFLNFKKEKEHPGVEDITLQEHGGHEEKGGEHGEGHGEEKGGGLKSAFSKNSEKMIALDAFTVNLSTPGSSNPKFVRVNISLEVQNDDTENEVNLKGPQVRNTIIDLFNSKKASDLATVDGREFLKEEIRSSINGFLVSGKIKGVFFTSFSLSG